MPLTTTITWIPTSERLPEGNDSEGRSEKLLYLHYGKHLRIGRLQTDNDWKWWVDNYSAYPLCDVTHWAPMPTFTDEAR